MNLIPSGSVRLLGLFAAALIVSTAHATDYYVANSGSNSNSGHSTGAPWADFTNVSSVTFAPGDNLYLARGSTWNQELHLQGGGSSGSPVQVTAYGSGAAPKISRSDQITDLCINVIAGEYFTFSFLELCHAQCGILLDYSSGISDKSGITIENNYFHDIDVDGDTHYSTGIYFGGDEAALPSSSHWTCKGVTIANNTFDGVFVPMQMNQNLKGDSRFGSGNSNPYCWQNIVVHSNAINNCGFQSAFWGITHALFFDNAYFNISDNDGHSHTGGTTGVFNEFSEDVTYSNNWTSIVNDSGSTDETMYDQESFNNGTNFYSNFMSNTAGPGIELLNLAGDGPGNYMTNTLIDGNIFVHNSTAVGSSWLSGLGIYDDASTTPTGTIVNNFYHENAGLTFENSSALWSAYTQSGNNGSNSGGYINNAADGFSSTQGAGNWSYAYWPGSGAVLNATFSSGTAYDGSDSTGRWSDPSGGSVTRFDMDPSPNSAYWVYRAWTAPVAGTVSVRGRVLKSQTGGGTIRVAIANTSGTIIWPTGGSTQNLGGSDQSGYDTHLDGVTLAAGDKLYFALNNSSGTSTNALVSWTPTVVYTSGGVPNNLLTNPGFESGTSGWIANAASGISADSGNAHSSTYGCHVTGRSAAWGSAYQDIKSILLDNGSGNYNLSGWVKFASGSDGTFLVIKITDSLGDHFVTTSTTTVGTTYTQLSGSALSVSWSGTLMAAALYVDDSTSTADVYLDDFSLTKP